MKQSYQEQDQVLKQRMAEIEPQVKAFLKSTPTQVYETPQFEQEDAMRFGEAGTVFIKIEKDTRPLSKDLLVKLIPQYLANHGISAEVGRECAEHCWKNRITADKEVVQRAYGHKNNKKRKLEIKF